MFRARQNSGSRSPWLYVPSLYFQQGLPVLLVQQFSVLFYKKMGIANDQIGLWTSIIAWPWIIKMFWGPVVDMNFTRRKWVQTMQLLITLTLGAAALGATSSHFLPVTLSIFALVAFFSATHDIALDGFYLIALRKDQQAFFMGITSTFFRLGWIFATGTLVVIAGLLERRGLTTARAWQAAILVGAAVYGILMVYGFWATPRVAGDVPVKRGAARQDHPGWSEAFKTFFGQDQALWILLFILFYRFSESMLTKMSGLFLLDPRSAGGLGLDTVAVGAIIGNVGVIALVAGGLIGGILIAKVGLRPLIWPMAILMHLPNLLYLWAAQTQPGVSALYAIVPVEQFSYGFGMAAYMVYTMYVSQTSRYTTTHYAIATALMALGASIAGISSGFIQTHLGWVGFFTTVCIVAIPSTLLLFKIPMNPELVPQPMAEAIASA